MNYSVYFLSRYLHLVILLLGIIILLTIGILNKKITRKFVVTISRLRILYGYIAAIISIISFIVFIYKYPPFTVVTFRILFAEFSAFSIGIYLLINLVVLILVFSNIVNQEFNSEQSYISFISLLVIQISAFLLFTSLNWIYILFGFILLYTGINWYIRYSFRYTKENQTRIFDKYIIINGISLSLLFIGLSIYFVSFETFKVKPILFSNTLIESFSIILIVLSLLILIGLPPFHFWVFEHAEKNLPSSFIILVIQRSIVFTFLVRISMIFRESEISLFLFWIILSLGILSCIWGIFGGLALNNLKKLIHYLALMQFGFSMIIFSLTYAKDSFSEMYAVDINTILKATIFNILGYVLLFALLIPLIALICEGYRTDNIQDLRMMRRDKLIPTVLFILGLILSATFTIFSGIISGIFDFSRTSRSPTLVSVFYLVLTIFLIVLLIRILNEFFIKKPTRFLEFNQLEPGFHLSIVFAVCFLLLLAIFSTKISAILAMMTESL